MHYVILDEGKIGDKKRKMLYSQLKVLEWSNAVLGLTLVKLYEGTHSSVDLKEKMN